MAERETKTSKGLQWGRDLSVAEGWRDGQGRGAGGVGFNGAATFRSRKAQAGDAWVAGDMALQWGRDLSVAEGCSISKPSRSHS